MTKAEMQTFMAWWNAKKKGEISNLEMERRLKICGFVKENMYQDAKMTSRFVDITEDISYNQDVLPLHSHGYYEVLYCMNGNVQYLLDTRRFQLRRGSIVVIPPGVNHRPLSLEKLAEPYRRYVLFVSVEFAKSMLSAFPGCGYEYDAGIVLHTAETMWEYMDKLFRTGYQEAVEQKPGWDICLTGIAMQISVQLQRMMNGKDMQAPIEKNRELLEDVLLYIERNFAEKITLKSAARYLLVSESVIVRLFRSKMGTSFYRYVTQRRLIAAKNYMPDGRPLESICGDVGFTDYSTFYRAFKREYGVSPQQYRQILAMPEGGQET